MRGTGYGHDGPVGEILAALPTDSTFHITDCGYDDNEGRCGCYDLPAKLQRIIDAAKAEALDDVDRRLAARIGEGRDDPETSREGSYFAGFLDALESARSEVARKRPDVSANRCSPGQAGE